MAQLQLPGVQHGTAWFAYEQTKGKGQRAKQWHTKPGQNIIISVALNTNSLPVSAQFYLSVAMAIAAHDVFSKYAGSETCVKWPNDIYWNDRKAGGILIENIIRGDKWQWAVVGMGININQTSFGDNAANAVSLKQITGKNFDVITIAKELHNCINARFKQVAAGKDVLLACYNQVLYKRGKEVQLRKENILFRVVIKEVTPDGRLLVEGAAWNSFGFGEVEWLVSP